MNLNYQEIYRRLQYEVATIIFVKGNGEIRVMLATKDVFQAARFNGEDIGGMERHLQAISNRCNIKNGNISVIDIAIGEARSFKLGRLIDIYWHGEIGTAEKAEELYRGYKGFLEKYLSDKNYTEEAPSMDDI